MRFLGPSNTSRCDLLVFVNQLSLLPPRVTRPPALDAPHQQKAVSLSFSPLTQRHLLFACARTCTCMHIFVRASGPNLSLAALQICAQRNADFHREAAAFHESSRGRRRQKEPRSWYPAHACAHWPSGLPNIWSRVRKTLNERIF